MIPSNRNDYYHRFGEKPRLFNRNGKEIRIELKLENQSEIITCSAEDDDIEVANMSILTPACDNSIDAVAYMSYYQVCHFEGKDYFHCALCNAFNDENILKKDVTKRVLRTALSYSISNVVTHLSSQHFEWLKLSKLIHLQDQVIKENKKPTGSYKKQLGIRECYKRSSDTPAEKAAVVKNELDPDFVVAVAKYIAQSNLPLNTVNSAAFRDFVKAITGKEKKFPSRQKITATMGILYDENNRKFIESMKKRNRHAMSITTDMSTGRNDASYCVITAHFLDSKFTRLFEELLVIAPFESEHEGENIREFVSQEILKVVKPGKSVESKNLYRYIIAITGDCASNNATAFEKLDDIYRIRCFGHRLNTLGKSLDFKGEELLDENGNLPADVSPFSTYSLCVYKLNRFLHHTHGKALLKSQLKQYQINANTGVKGPIKGARTRWTYGPKYLKRSMALLLDLEGLFKQQITPFAGIDEVNDLMAEFRSKYSVFEYFMELFSRIKFWIETTESSKYPTSSMVLYALDDLRALVDNLITQLEEDELNLETGNKDALEIPIKIFKTFKTEMKKVFVNDSRHRTDPTVESGENQKFFGDNLLLKVAKIMDIRFMFLDIVGNNCNINFPWEKVDLIKQYYIKRYKGDFGRDLYTEKVLEITDSLVTGKPRSERVTGEDRFNKEVDNYINLCSIEINSIRSKYTEKSDQIKEILNLDPLKFWQDNHENFEFLSKIAGQVLAVPAQSAPSERVFSRMTAVISSGRTRLTSKNGAKLIQLCQRYLSRILPRSPYHDQVRRKRTSLIVKNGKIEYPPFGAFTKELKYIDYDIIEQENDDDYEPSDTEDEEDDDEFEIETNSDDNGNNDDHDCSDSDDEVSELPNDSKKRARSVNYVQLNGGKASRTGTK